MLGIFDRFEMLAIPCFKLAMRWYICCSLICPNAGGMTMSSFQGLAFGNDVKAHTYEPRSLVSLHTL